MYLYVWLKKNKKNMSGKLICHSVALKKGGVYPPFKQLKLNFLPIFGLFWAFSALLFTCLTFNILHYLYNVVQQNGCFPLLVRFSGVFAILPVIIPSLSPFSLSFLFLWCFLGRVPGQIRADPRKIRADPAGSWAGSWADQTRRTRTDQADQDRPIINGVKNRALFAL